MGSIKSDYDKDLAQKSDGSYLKANRKYQKIVEVGLANGSSNMFYGPVWVDEEEYVRDYDIKITLWNLKRKYEEVISMQKNNEIGDFYNQKIEWPKRNMKALLMIWFGLQITTPKDIGFDCLYPVRSAFFQPEPTWMRSRPDNGWIWEKWRKCGKGSEKRVQLDSTGRKF